MESGDSLPQLAIQALSYLNLLLMKDCIVW